MAEARPNKAEGGGMIQSDRAQRGPLAVARVREYSRLRAQPGQPVWLGHSHFCLLFTSRLTTHREQVSVSL